MTAHELRMDAARLVELLDELEGDWAEADDYYENSTLTEAKHTARRVLAGVVNGTTERRVRQQPQPSKEAMSTARPDE